MATYYIYETLAYKVEADSYEEAEDLIVNDDDRDTKYFIGVIDRHWEED